MKLVQLVKKKKIIFDKDFKNFHSVSHRQEAINEIAKELNKNRKYIITFLQFHYYSQNLIYCCKKKYKISKFLNLNINFDFIHIIMIIVIY